MLLISKLLMAFNLCCWMTVFSFLCLCTEIIVKGSSLEVTWEVIREKSFTAVVPTLCTGHPRTAQITTFLILFYRKPFHFPRPLKDISGSSFNHFMWWLNIRLREQGLKCQLLVLFLSHSFLTSFEQARLSNNNRDGHPLRQQLGWFHPATQSHPTCL